MVSDGSNRASGSIPLTTGTQFPHALREFRLRMRVSQNHLARAAGFDHSYLSRLEIGDRNPTCETVHSLARAMQLSDTDTDALLVAAGFFPTDLVVAELLQFLGDPSVDPQVRDDIRNMVAVLLRQARRVPAERMEMLP